MSKAPINIDLRREIKPINTSVTTEVNPNVFYEALQADLSYFNSENAPSSYEGINKEVKILSEIRDNTGLIIAHRIKIIRDNELYKDGGYPDFKTYVEQELDIARSLAYTYIDIVEIFGVLTLGHDGYSIGSLARIVPYVRKNPDLKEQLLEKAKELSIRQLEKYINENLKLKQVESTQKDVLEDFPKSDGWYSSREELLAHSKFLRDGMKPKTQVKMIKELINLRLLEEPKNKELQKIREILSKL